MQVALTMKASEWRDGLQVALEAVTAAHQLSIAVHTLGLVARPLLLAGLALGEGDAYGGASLKPRVRFPPNNLLLACTFYIHY